MNFKNFYHFIFYISIFEVVIGGGGNFFKFNGISLRMILFGISCICSIILILQKKKIDKVILIIFITFIILDLVGVIIGLINKTKIEYLITNIQSNLIFLLLPFYYYNITNIRDINKLLKIIKIGVICLLFFHFIFLGIIYFKLINFQIIYSKISTYEEVYFRGNNLFFYKGFIYTCIGFFMFFLTKGKKNRVISLLLLLSITLTLTRGFIYFTFAIIFFYMLFLSKNIKIKMTLILFGIVFFMFILPYVTELRRKDVYISDSVRYETFNQVIGETNLLSFFIGNGFGSGVPIRPIGMENSFLDFYQKSGIIGFLFWIGLFFYLIFMTIKLQKTHYYKLALIFLLGVGLIYIQSLTNPYINTIGLPFIMLSLVVLTRLNQIQFNQNVKN